MTFVEDITKLFTRKSTPTTALAVRRSPANVTIYDALGTSLVPVRPEPIIIPYYPEEYPPVVMPSTPPQTVTAHKIVRVTKDGLFMSLVDLIDGGLPHIYEIGKTIREPARPDHAAGLFAYWLPPGELVKRFLQGRDGHVFGELEAGSYGLLEVETRGPFVAYTKEGMSLGYVESPMGGEGKFAASEMTPRRLQARFLVAKVHDPYRRLWRVYTTEVRGVAVDQKVLIES